MTDTGGPLTPDRPDAAGEFRVDAPFDPAGDQPEAIDQLTAGFQQGMDKQTLLGVTGSGKTNTVSWVIENLTQPTLVIAHNKTLAAQLYEEFRELFPDNAVEYFVSYYDNHPYHDDPDAALFCPKPDAPLPDDRDPRGPIHYQTIRNRLHRIGEKAGIEPEKKVYPHLLRHTAITRMVLEGLNEQKIKKVVGWAPDSSQFETYVSLADDLSKCLNQA